MSATTSTKERIINNLLLNTSFIENLGLMYGKMGISIFFFHLARKTKNKIYEDYAGELIDEISESITVNTSIDFGNGLAGIGWGIEYLAQNGFIEADTDEILEEFDNLIFKEFVYRTPKELGLLNGIIGIGAYFLKRIQNPASNDEKISTLTNKQTLIHIIDELDRRTQNVKEIIEEPTNYHNRITTDYMQEDTNNQTSRSSNSHPLQQSKLETFDIIWDYPVLIYFLSELHEQNIFNFKIEKILKRIITPLYKDNYLPNLYSNRLLLEFVIRKLRGSIHLKESIFNDSTTFRPPQTTQTISEMFTIGSEIILSELPKNNETIRYGTSGVIWIYKQLKQHVERNSLAKKHLYWKEHVNNKFTQSINEAFDFENNLTALGILEGLAGQIFVEWITDI